MAKSHQDIQLSGENILDEHCVLEHTQGEWTLKISCYKG